MIEALLWPILHFLFSWEELGIIGLYQKTSVSVVHSQSPDISQSSICYILYKTKKYKQNSYNCYMISIMYEDILCVKGIFPSILMIFNS